MFKNDKLRVISPKNNYELSIKLPIINDMKKIN